MKREFLTELGIEKETIDKIMAEHGKTIQAEIDKNKTELDGLNAKLSDANQTIEKISESQQSLDSIQKIADEYKANFEQTSKELKEMKIKEALVSHGGQDTDYLMFKLGEVDDLEKLNDLVKNLKETYPTQFKTETDKQEIKVEGYEVVSDKLNKGDEVKTYSMDEIANLSTQQINENWDVISQTLSNNK